MVLSDCDSWAEDIFGTARLGDLRRTSSLAQHTGLSIVKSSQPTAGKASSLKWAYLSLAKLGHRYDSKRTGRAGWIVMWEGWIKLQYRVEGYRQAKSLEQAI